MTTELQNAVIEQLGYNEDDLDQTSVCYDELIGTLQDVANHGANAGWSGFIYYTDTVKFAEDNLSLIKSHLKDMADSLGEQGIYSLVSSFNCIDLNPDQVADAIHDPETADYTQVMNALAWYALEETARELTEED